MENIKVIIIDDDRVILSGLSSMLDWETHGFEVVATAANGRQGLSCFFQHMPHVVFTDIKMPVMDGLDMIKAIRADNLAARFIILSAFGEFGFAKKAIELGASAYILKTELNPESMAGILRQLRRDLESQAKRAFDGICDTVFSFVWGDGSKLGGATQRVERLLAAHLDLGEEYGLAALGESMGASFHQKFEQLGISSYYAPPPLRLGRDALGEWIVAQMRKVDKMRQGQNGGYPPVIANALFHIHENVGDKDLSIKAVSEHVAMSESRLCFLFKREVGRTIIEYVTDLRVQKAKALLRQGRHRVHEIADEVGFSSAEYFSRIFSKATGMPPGKFRDGGEA